MWFSNNVVAVTTGALVSALGLLAMSWAVSPPAVRAAAPACFQDPGSDPDDDYGSISYLELYQGQIQETISGIRSDAKVVNEATPCGQVTSVFVIAGNLQVVEFGWARGWLSCHGDPGTYTWHDDPIPFAVALDGSRKFCRKWPNRSLRYGTTHNMRVSDENENGWWGGWLDGEEMQSSGWQLFWTQGAAGINGERQNPDDSNRANFGNIQECINEVWSVTNDLGDRYDTDPDYRAVFDNEHHVRFVHI